MTPLIIGDIIKVGPSCRRRPYNGSRRRALRASAFRREPQLSFLLPYWRLFPMGGWKRGHRVTLNCNITRLIHRGFIRRPISGWALALTWPRRSCRPFLACFQCCQIAPRPPALLWSPRRHEKPQTTQMLANARFRVNSSQSACRILFCGNDPVPSFEIMVRR